MNRIKDLPLKEKLENIWYYYKWYILAGVFLVLSVSILISSFLTRENYVFNVSIVGYYENLNKDEVTNFQKEVTKLVVPASRKNTSALIDLYQAKNTNSKYKDLEPSAVEKLSVKMAAKDVDILIINKDDFDFFMKQGTFFSLDYLNLDSNDKNSKLIKSNSSVYGVSVEGNKLLNKIGYDTKDKFIGILANSKDKKNSEEVLNWILKYD
ncbi:hypothetical protein [Clostridium omnivorum]|uniref:ABC transporter substrate-binding protein n=1 Tax=Clostridium omnivorum TaxID=1604902 RepID=A0ABQ5N2Q1_9CLOT|nr:hypothetical protein [Clostridium sp. E14]GLC29465.1 hypothetical protein bsdE14_08750 [Clostridium sp. E14]